MVSGFASPVVLPNCAGVRILPAGVVTAFTAGAVGLLVDGAAVGTNGTRRLSATGTVGLSATASVGLERGDSGGGVGPLFAAGLMAGAAGAIFAGAATAEFFGFEGTLGGIALDTGVAAVFCAGTDMGMDRSATFGESELVLAHKRSALPWLPEEPGWESALSCSIAA